MFSTGEKVWYYMHADHACSLLGELSYIAVRKRSIYLGGVPWSTSESSMERMSHIYIYTRSVVTEAINQSMLNVGGLMVNMRHLVRKFIGY